MPDLRGYRRVRLAFTGTPIAKHYGMQKTILLLTAILAVGCSKTSMRSNGKAQASTAATATPVVQNNPAMSNEQVTGVGNALSGIIFGLIQNLQGLQNFDFTKQLATFNQPYTCPLGGTVTMGGQAQIATNVGIGTASGQLVNASGAINFAYCKLALANGQTLTLNGTISLSSISGSLNANYGLSGGTFTANSQSAWNGNLQVIVGTFDRSCALTFNHSASGSGTVNASLQASGNYTLSATGQVCGQNLNVQMTDSL